MTHLILELSDHQAWGQPAHLIGASAPHIIPEARRPTMLQTDRETAEREAMRLARTRPGGVFVVFAPVCAGMLVAVPTHITIGGQVVLTKKVPTLVDIHDPDEVPF